MDIDVQFTASQVGVLTYCNQRLSIHCFFVVASDWDYGSGVIIEKFLERMRELGYFPFPDVFSDPTAEMVFSFDDETETEAVWIFSEAENHGKFCDHVLLQRIRIDVPKGICENEESNLMPVTSPILFGRKEGLVLRGPKISVV